VKSKPLQEKIQHYLNSGLRLGWLINPQSHQVEVYRIGQSQEVVESPVTLSGEDILLGLSMQIY
jgi:Uma2 family endonuclease